LIGDVTDVTEKLPASALKVVFFDYPEDGGSTLLVNVGNKLSTNKASYRIIL
jgi:hypothetical protein